MAYAAEISTDHKLFCGKTKFVIRALQSSGKGPNSQVLYAYLPNGTKIKANLHIAYTDSNNGRSYSQPAASIEEWKCVKTTKSEFVELLFSCNEDIGDANVDRYCGGSAIEEWTSYLSLDGKLLDADFKISDQRYELLWKRLGLPNLADGKARTEVMTPVD